MTPKKHKARSAAPQRHEALILLRGEVPVICVGDSDRLLAHDAESFLQSCINKDVEVVLIRAPHLPKVEQYLREFYRGELQLLADRALPVASQDQIRRGLI
jgi:hypothetical protein